MSSLTLIGTVHRDPWGLRRLVEELTRLRPQVITLEFSVYGMKYRQERKRYLTTKLLKELHKIRGPHNWSARDLKKLLRSTGIGGIRALLDLPFEYKGARLYSQRHGLPLHCLDSSTYSRQLLKHVDELISPGNLKKVIACETAPLKETVKSKYQHAENLLLNGRQSPGLQPSATDEDYQKREKIMADRISKIVVKYPRCTIVHIGGWQHLVVGEGTLFTLLEDLEPKRILLGRLYL
jgi:hypothetical protein